MIEIQINQVGDLIKYSQGSDIIVFPDHYNLQSPTAAFSEELMQIEGIERTSAILASEHDLEHIYSEGDEDDSLCEDS